MKHDCNRFKPTLIDLVYDEIPPEEAAKIKREIMTCLDCLAEYRALTEMVGVVEEANRSLVPAGLPERIAAAVAERKNAEGENVPTPVDGNKIIEEMKPRSADAEGTRAKLIYLAPIAVAAAAAVLFFFRTSDEAISTGLQDEVSRPKNAETAPAFEENPTKPRPDDAQGKRGLLEAPSISDSEQSSVPGFQKKDAAPKRKKAASPSNRKGAKKRKRKATPKPLSRESATQEPATTRAASEAWLELDQAEDRSTAFGGAADTAGGYDAKARSTRPKKSSTETAESEVRYRAIVNDVNAGNCEQARQKLISYRKRYGVDQNFRSADSMVTQCKARQRKETQHAQ